MGYLFSILALFSFCYYIAIVSYAGLPTSFSWFWLLQGSVSAFSALLIFHNKIFRRTWIVHLARIEVLVLLLWFLLLAVLGTKIVGGMLTEPKPGLDYVVVLGAQVRGSKISLSLQFRLEEALRYGKENPNTIFVLSGGQGNGEELSEAQAMHDWLLAHGMEENRMRLEDKSTTTVENLEYSAALVDKTKEIGVVSNDFHIYRACRIAKKQGYQQVYGLAAKGTPILRLHNVLRECMALLKEMIFGNI